MEYSVFADVPAAFDKRDDVSCVSKTVKKIVFRIVMCTKYQIPNTVKYSVCLIPNTVYRAHACTVP